MRPVFLKTNNIMKGCYIFLAQGFEDVEALGVCDVLRRGGVEVTLVSIEDSLEVTSSHSVTVKAEMNLAQALEKRTSGSETKDDFMIFPGGMPGSERLAACAPLTRELREHYLRGGSVAAICAAPGLVLKELGCSLNGVEFTCFEGFEKHLEMLGAIFRPESAVVSGRIITGRSAGHAFTFGLKILEYLKGGEAAAKVRHALYLD